MTLVDRNVAIVPSGEQHVVQHRLLFRVTNGQVMVGARFALTFGSTPVVHVFSRSPGGQTIIPYLR
jgi:hypothetical protein